MLSAVLGYAIATAIVVLTTVYLYFQHSYRYWRSRGVPHLAPGFPYGNARDLVKENKSFGLFAADIYNRLKDVSGQLGGFYVLNQPAMMLFEPELIKTVLTREYGRFQSRGLYYNEELEPLTGHLVNLSGKKWRMLRAKLSPAFTSGKIKFMFQTLVVGSRELGQILDGPATNNEAVDIADVLGRLTTDNIGACAFGLNCNSLKDPDAEFRTYGKLIIDSTLSAAFKNVIAVNFPKLFEMFNVKMIRDDVATFLTTVLKETIDYRKANDVSRKDFIDLFMNMDEYFDGEKYDPITFNEMAAQAFVFFVAGFETSSTMMTFCVYEMAVNRDLQGKLREEVLGVLGKHNGEVSYEAIQEMGYLDKVVSETLRKYPSLPFLNRRCNEELKIPNSKYVIERDARVWISVYGLHRDPKYYPNPDKFDPERFSEEECAKRHPYVYLPFGEGPKICIGIRFAKLQIKIGIVELIRSYEFSLHDRTVEPIGFKNRGIFLSPGNKIYVTAKKI